MGTYYHGDSEIQGGGDGLQTLILMNPAFVGYGDGQQAPPSGAVAQGNNFVFLNSGSAAAGVGNNLSHGAPPQTQHFVGIPLHRPPPSSPQQQQDVSALHGFIAQRATTYGLYNLPMDMSAAARDVTRSQGGLSLSLSSHQQHPQSLGGGYGPPFGSAAERDVAPSRQQFISGVSPSRGGEEVRISGGSPSSASAVSNGVTGGVQSVLLSSKYLKAAQELLDEVVNVGKGARTPAGESSSKATTTNSHNKTAAESSVSGAAANEPDNVGSSSKLAADLTTAERQEVQMKKAKLVNMLDEVEQRYRQYHHQMQIVVAWFEQAAGIGSAKTYTALALQTISKQFRCLKDAILEQIRSVSKTLGEDENLEGKIEGSRLKYVDNQIRQQRALQQLGMIQNNAWRPQRGLPERSVSVLRAWLFEHFLHPYPKDSDKLMLAKQTGLTRSQVSNWFINARVRLWKPMVEEMYMEEMKENERNGSEDMAGKSERDESTAAAENRNQKLQEGVPILQNPAPAMSNSPTGMANMRNFNLIRPSEIDHIAQVSPKKMRNVARDVLHSPASITAMSMESKPGDEETLKFHADRQNREAGGGGFTLLGAPTNFISGFGSYPMAELGRYTAEQFPAAYSGNGVSLTLGLPHSHCENLQIQGSHRHHHHQNFLPNQSIQLGRGVEISDPGDYAGLNPPAGAAPGNIYENINIQSRKRFASQLLPDFVA